MSLVAAVAGDGGGSGVLAPHLAPNLRRARDRVHLARVPRARGVRGLQRARGTLRHLLQVHKLYLGFIIGVQIDYLYFILQVKGLRKGKEDGHGQQSRVENRESIHCIGHRE